MTKSESSSTARTPSQCYKSVVVAMSESLTPTGKLWSLCSVLSALLSCTGYYLPYWIQGEVYNTTVHLGIFRRCNYLTKLDDGTTKLEQACGRYTNFADIPSEAWKVCTVMMGAGCALLLLVALTTVFSCCLQDVVTNGSARFGGTLQFLAGFLLAISCGIYPSGWGSNAVKQACGKDADFYEIGHCRLGWAFFIFVIGISLAFICSGLSLRAGKKSMSSDVEDSNSFM